jgi:23S rRNA pseudouridine2605 synthase
MTRNSTPAGERLQKVLANAGMGSRREIEGWIRDGKVEVNGSLAQLGQRVLPTDNIKVDGRKVSVKRLEAPEREVLVYNKPEGEVVTRHDPEGRRTIFQGLPRLKHGRWVPVGRLDINSSGLLLLTTDGELANQLMHPSRQVEREYAVRVMGTVTEEQLKSLVNGVELEDGPARFEEIVESGGEGINRWYHVVIMEGRQREVRRMWEAVGAKVNRLKRVRYGSVMLDSALKVGRWRYLHPPEIEELMKTLGLKSDTQTRKPSRRPSTREEKRESRAGGPRPKRKPQTEKRAPDGGTARGAGQGKQRSAEKSSPWGKPKPARRPTGGGRRR